MVIALGSSADVAKQSATDIVITSDAPDLMFHGRNAPASSTFTDYFGYSSGHGHINGHADNGGDEYEDVYITAGWADGPGGTRGQAGEAYLFLGRSRSDFSSVTTLDAAAGDQALTIYGPSANAFFGLDGNTVAHGSDVNADGSDDMVIGAFGANRAYVILGSPSFGKEDGSSSPYSCSDGSDNGDSDGADIADSDCYWDLASKSASLTITGESNDGLGFGIAVGDINGDAYPDIALGAGGGLGTSSQSSGRVYVLFGNADIGKEDGVPGGCSDGTDNGGGDGADIADSDCHWDLSSTAADVTIYGVDSGDTIDRVEIGNLNGTDSFPSDKIGDLVIATAWGDGSSDSASDAGEAYIIRGRTSWPTTIDLAAGEQSLTIYGSDTGDQLGFGAYMGDVNGDLIDDAIVGALGDDGPGNGTSCGTGQVGDRCSASAAYVFFGFEDLGKEDGVANGCGDGADNGGGDGADANDPDCVIDLASSSADVVIWGESGDPGNVISVHAGHMNDDEFEEIVVGIAGAGGSDKGRTYVIRGSDSLASEIDLGDLNYYDLRVTGDHGDQSGWWLSLLDLNGDQVSEIVTSAPYGDGPGTGSCGSAVGDRCHTGDAYVIFDADLDGVMNGSEYDDDGDMDDDDEDNCPAIVNSGQEDEDDDDIGDECEDEDGDSLHFRTGVRYNWRDSVELYVGTSRTDGCADTTAANNEDDDKWPPDFDDNRAVNTTDLFVLFSLYGDVSANASRQRADFDMSGVVDDDDFVIFGFYYGRTCTP
jgi:hypothetical protein